MGLIILDNLTVDLEPIDSFLQTNPFGHRNMVEFSMMIAKELENLLPRGLEMQVHGIPYASFDVQWKIHLAEDALFDGVEELKTDTLQIACYPAGFRFRYDDIKEKFFTELLLEITSFFRKLERIPLDNYCLRNSCENLLTDKNIEDKIIYCDTCSKNLWS